MPPPHRRLTRWQGPTRLRPALPPLHAVVVALLLFLLSCTQSVSGQNPDFSLYHKTDDILAQAAAIAQRNPSIFSSASCPSSSSPIPYYSISSPQPLSHLATPKLRLLLNFGEHGRELVTSEIALALLLQLDLHSRQEHRHDAAAASEAPSEDEDEFSYDRYRGDDHDVSDEYLAFLLRNTQTVVVPVLNLWGRRQVEGGDACSRKNRNGVDLNRNWDFLFSHNNKPPQDETYQGPAAFSEEETRCLRDVATELRPAVYVNVHSGIQELYFGWDHRGDVMLPNMREVTRLYEQVNSFHCSCKVGSAGKIAGYVVHGGSMDWMYDRLNVSYSLTYEVYGLEGRQGCFLNFNPSSRAQLQDTVSRFSSSFLTMQAFLIEEKLGLIFPYRPPSFALSPLFLQEDRKAQRAVRVFYHPMRLLLPLFSASSASLPLSASSTRPLPVFDPHELLSQPASASTSQLRVLVLADTQWNHHFSSELALHLVQQRPLRQWRLKLQLVLVPTVYPEGRAAGELCWDGLTAMEQRLRAKELYEGEEEVERISRHLRPHLVLELQQSNRSAEPKRSRLDQFDLHFHNSSNSNAAFTAAAIAAVASASAPSAAAPAPFTSHLALSTFLHFRLTYRPRTEPDMYAERRRQSDRVPPAVYRTQSASPHRVVQCDWPQLNPAPSGLRDAVSDAMRQLHAVLESLSRLQVDAAPAVVKEEQEGEEGERRRVLFMGEEMMQGALGREEGDSWVPNVWQEGVGWHGWLLLAAVVGTAAGSSLLGFRWIQQKSRELKATSAV